MAALALNICTIQGRRGEKEKNSVVIDMDTTNRHSISATTAKYDIVACADRSILNRLGPHVPADSRQVRAALAHLPLGMADPSTTGEVAMLKVQNRPLQAEAEDAARGYGRAADARLNRFGFASTIEDGYAYTVIPHCGSLGAAEIIVARAAGGLTGSDVSYFNGRKGRVTTAHGLCWMTGFLGGEKTHPRGRSLPTAFAAHIV
jgi:hypothetical protein